MTRILDLDLIEQRIDEAVNQTAVTRASLGAELNGLLRTGQVPTGTDPARLTRIRACVFTCLLDIPSGGPLEIPACTRHDDARNGSTANAVTE